jgi:hypothetical protein
MCLCGLAFVCNWFVTATKGFGGAGAKKDI